MFFESCTSDIDAEDYYSPASDIWSFGSVCLHLAMGFCCPRHQYQVREGRDRGGVQVREGRERSGDQVREGKERKKVVKIWWGRGGIREKTR